jgi:hypothetical protein
MKTSANQFNADKEYANLYKSVKDLVRLNKFYPQNNTIRQFVKTRREQNKLYWVDLNDWRFKNNQSIMPESFGICI